LGKAIAILQSVIRNKRKRKINSLTTNLSKSKITDKPRRNRAEAEGKGRKRKKLGFREVLQKWADSATERPLPKVRRRSKERAAKRSDQKQIGLVRLRRREANAGRRR